MFALDSLVHDLIFGAQAQPSAEQLIAGVGGEEAARNLLIVDADLDAPQVEMEISPTVPLRRRGERRLLVVDESVAPMRRSPQTDPIVPRDLRPARDRLVELVTKTGARLGRVSAFGTWGEAVIVVRSARDLRGILLLAWALDPTTDLEGRRRANPLSQQEFEQKLLTYDKRLDELDDATILARVPPARLERRNGLLVVDVLSDRDGSWDIRKSYELERRVGAIELFARIPGARVTAQPAAPAPAPAAARAEARPAPPPEPPRPAGPPIRALDVDGRVILRIPAERFDLDSAAALGRRNLDVLRPGDQVTGKQRDRIHEHGAGFVAPLAYLSEVFLEGKPLDRRRFEAEAAEVAPGTRILEAHLPRFGPVRVIDLGGKRWVTSEVDLDPARVVELVTAATAG